MADNPGFAVSGRGDQEKVFATNVGDANNPGTGEVIPLFREIDSSNIVSYTKMDGSAYTPSDLEIVDYAPIRLSLGSEVLTVGTGATALAAVPAHAVRAEIQVHTGADNICWTVTGEDPDPANSKGRLSNQGSTVNLEGMHEVNNFRGIALANDGKSVGTEVVLYVQYTNITEDNSYAK